MNRDPDRWLQDPSVDPKLSDLVRSASPALDLPVAVQTRIEARLEQLANVAGAGAAGPSVAAAAKPAISVAIASKAWLIVSGVALSALVGGVIWQRLDTSSRSVPRVTSHATVEALHMVEPAATVIEPSVTSVPAANAVDPTMSAPAGHAVEPSVTSVSELALVPEPALATSRPKVTKYATPNAAAKWHTDHDLAEEARLLEAARASISTDPAAARRALALYDARFPSGALRQERSLVAVRLAVVEGRRDEAKSQAVKLEQSAKGSPFAKKARELVDSNERPKSSGTINE